MCNSKMLVLAFMFLPSDSPGLNGFDIPFGFDSSHTEDCLVANKKRI